MSTRCRHHGWAAAPESGRAGGVRPMLRKVAVALLFCLAVHSAAADTARRPLLVTVDDLPMSVRDHPDPVERERVTRALLEVLARHEIRAVGLVTWRNVRDPSDRRLLELWLQAGHELGNHSFSHPDFTATGTEAYIADMEAAREQLSTYLAAHGRRLRFFRFPFLREGNTLEKLRAMRSWLSRTGQRNLPVTIDNQDWSFERPWIEARQRGDLEQLLQIGERYQETLHLAVRHHERTGDALLGRISPQILLLHATEVGTAQWDALFNRLEDTGHRFATADEVLADPAFASLPEYVGSHGPGLWDRRLAVQRTEQAHAEVRHALQQQVDAWNRGDLTAFCSIYEEDAIFLSPSGVTRGRDAVLSRYRRRYPDPAAMGTLGLDLLDVRTAEGTEVSMMEDARPSRVHGVTVAARWTLVWPDREPATGLTLLTLRPGSNGWRIAQDASMAAE